MKRFALGDIHGANIALEQCLERSDFDVEKDLLISLGDVCDGWPETNQCFETLLGIKNLILTMGNHDLWAFEWALGNEPNLSWLSYGGKNTMESYPDGMPDTHFNLLANSKHYYSLENKLFVHAGIELEKPVEDQDAGVLLWDREFFREAMHRKLVNDQTPLTCFDEVYIGHTPIHRLGHSKPLQCSEVWMMDTGAGWGEKLSIMNIDTKEVFQSDRVEDLYPKGSGRA